MNKSLEVTMLKASTRMEIEEYLETKSLDYQHGFYEGLEKANEFVEQMVAIWVGSVKDDSMA